MGTSGSCCPLWCVLGTRWMIDDRCTLGLSCRGSVAGLRCDVLILHVDCEAGGGLAAPDGAAGPRQRRAGSVSVFTLEGGQFRPTWFETSRLRTVQCEKAGWYLGGGVLKAVDGVWSRRSRLWGGWRWQRWRLSPMTVREGSPIRCSGGTVRKVSCVGQVVLQWSEFLGCSRQSHFCRENRDNCGQKTSLH